MSAFMIVYMTLSDSDWMTAYFAEVPKLIAEYGGTPVAGGRNVIRAEGDMPVPDRMAIIEFPSGRAAQDFLDDPRYRASRIARQHGSTSQIFLLENAAVGGALA